MAFSAMKPHKFSLSMNAKVQPDIINVAKWYMGAYENTDLQFVMYFDRWLFENCEDFQVSFFPVFFVTPAKQIISSVVVHFLLIRFFALFSVLAKRSPVSNC